MEKCTQLIIAKNRGWRGLTEVTLLNGKGGKIASQIFSFSQPMWDDLVERDIIVIQDDTEYYVIKFDPAGKLPTVDMQRSVIIRNVTVNILEVNKYNKTDWMRVAKSNDYSAIYHYTRNNNNHTTSDWNYIGLRVIPEI